MSDFLAGAQVGFGIQDRMQSKRQRIADGIHANETEKLAAALQARREMESDRDYALREKGLGVKIDAASAERDASGLAAEQRENEFFTQLNPAQQKAYLAGNVPAGLGVLAPDGRNPRMRKYVDRMAIVNESLDRETEAAKTRKLGEIASALNQQRIQEVRRNPTATVQYGPGGEVQRQWVRGVSPDSVTAGLTPVRMMEQQPKVQQSVVAPEISSQDEFDRLPQGAPFVWRSSNGVQKGVKK